jgi:hypothetical protein
MNPNTELYDDDKDKSYKPTLTASQEKLWHIYDKGVNDTFEFAGDDELLLFHAGDLTHGDRFHVELVSDRLADQLEIAQMNLRPWYRYPHLTRTRLIRGTGVHVMGQGSSEIIVCNYLQQAFPKVDTSYKVHYLVDIDRVVFDIAHHGPHPGGRDWLVGNVARFYLRDLMYREQRRGSVPPRVVIRAHYHQPVHEYLEMGKDMADIFILPSMSMLEEHSQKATRSADEVTNGITLFEIIDGELASFKRLYTKTDVRQRETL